MLLSLVVLLIAKKMERVGIFTGALVAAAWHLENAQQACQCVVLMTHLGMFSATALFLDKPAKTGAIPSARRPTSLLLRPSTRRRHVQQTWTFSNVLANVSCQQTLP
jgi:hypothetical protein